MLQIHSILLMLAFIGLIGCAKPDNTSTTEKKTQIVTSNLPTALAVQFIVGDQFDVIPLVDGPQSPHELSLTVSQRQRIADSDLFVWLGEHSEAGLSKVVATLSPERVVAWQDHFGDNHVDDEHDLDPHLWLSIDAVRALGVVLTKRLQLESDWLARINQLEQQISVQIQNLPEFDFISHHHALGYFTDHFELPSGQHIRNSHGQSQGIKTTQLVSQYVQANCILVEPAHPAPDAERIAEKLAIPLISLDILGYSYPSKSYSALMLGVVDSLKQCAVAAN